MARTPYPDPDAEAAYQDIAANSAKATAVQNLSNDMKVDAYTGGLMSNAAGSQAQSIDNIVRKSR